MNVVKEYSFEERKWIENHINPEDVRNYFQKNNKNFHKIKAGFRAESLSDDDAVLLVTKNLEKKEIEQYLNDVLFVPEMNLFEKSFKTAKENGANETAALIIGISQTKFKECPDLFYKIYDEEISIVNQNIIRQIHQFLVDSNESKNDYKIRFKNKSKEAERRQIEIEEKQRMIETLSKQLKDSEEHNRKKNDFINNIKEKLLATENKLKQISDEQSKAKNKENEFKINMHREKEKILESFSDLPQNPSFKYEYERFSLVCRYVFYDDEKITYLRLADLDVAKNSVAEFKSAHNNGMFEQRKKILSYDLPDKDKDYYFVVNWRTEKHRRKPEYDWVDAVETNIKPIEIKIFLGCYNLDDVKRKLQEEIQLKESSLKWFFTYNSDENIRSGILVKKRQLEFANGMARLKKDVIQLPIFDLDLDHSFTVGCYEIKKLIYDKLYLGTPRDVATMLDNQEIVKTVIMEHMTWKTFKDRGYSKKNWQEIQNIIDESSNGDIYKRIQQLCGCTEDDVHTMVNSFFDYADAYIDYKDIDSNIIMKMFENNSKLWGGLIRDIRTKWEMDNERDLIEWKNGKEKIIQECLNAQEHALNIRKEEFANISRLLEEKNEQIKAAEAILNKVDRIEEKVREKMNSIKDDASSFIRDMFLSHPFWQAYFEPSSGYKLINDTESYHIETVQCHTMEENYCSNYKEIFNEFTYNLEECGVSEELSGALAAVLYACFMKNVTIILAGSMGAEIASMLGVSVDGKIPPIINLPNKYQSGIISGLSERVESVLVIGNALTSEWVAHIDSLLRIPNKYVIFLLPFYDDLQIIPKGVLSYCIPIITDVLLYNECLSNFSQSIRSENFQETPFKSIRQYRIAKIMNSMNVSVREQRRYENIINLAHEIRFSWGDLYDDNDLDSRVCKRADFIIIALSYCYMKDRAHILLQKEMGRDNSEFQKEELEKLFGTIGVCYDE